MIHDDAIPAVSVREAHARAVQCPDAAAVTVRAGCVHEHVRQIGLCVPHSQAASSGLCGACARLGHDCPILLQVLTDAT